MQSFRVSGLYSHDGRLVRSIAESWFLYAIFCEIENGVALVKIGRATNVYSRMMQLQVGIPYPISVVLFAEIGELHVASDVEKGIHRDFVSRRIRGEWFRFQLSDPVDKEYFHKITKAVVHFYSGMYLQWKKITPNQLAAYASLKMRKRKKKKMGIDSP